MGGVPGDRRRVAQRECKRESPAGLGQVGWGETEGADRRVRAGPLPGLGSWSQIHSHLWPAVVAACLLVSGGLTFANYFELLTPPGFELGRQGWRAIATPIYPFWTPELPTVGSADTLVFAVFFLGAFSCFGASALFHTSLCHTEEASTHPPSPPTPPAQPR